MKKIFWYFLLALPMMCFCNACANNEKGIVINADGTTSNGSKFAPIDDNSFYLDYIKYSIIEGHLEVSGYDQLGVNGAAKIASNITFNGIAYEVLGIGDDVFYECEWLTSVTIPSSVTKIGDYAFAWCTELTSVTIPNSVIKIGRGAFCGCRGLSTLAIGNRVTSIGPSAFRNCSGLTSIQVGNKNKIYDSRDNCNAIIETSSNTLIAGCKNTAIPNTVTQIGEAAFCGCEELSSIDIPHSVTLIGHEAFYGCTNLSSVDIPSSVTSIDTAAFTFCRGLTSVVIPNSVTLICDAAFEFCTGLTSIHCKGTTPPDYNYSYHWNNLFPSETYQMATLYVPKGSLEAYQSKSPWSNFTNIVEE